MGDVDGLFVGDLVELFVGDLVGLFVGDLLGVILGSANLPQRARLSLLLRPRPILGSNDYFWRRQTGNCDGNGPRESASDQACSAIVAEIWSGYCECGDGSIVSRVGYNHPTFIYSEKCPTKSLTKSVKTLSKSPTKSPTKPPVIVRATGDTTVVAGVLFVPEVYLL